jgi:multidrug efflux system membrane fusion protein
MRVKPQYLFVIAVIGVVALYFIVRSLFSAAAPHAQAKTNAAAAGPPSVQAKLVPEVNRPYDVVVRGRTQATRTVVVRSETAGVVAATPVLQGTMVKQGQVLCRLAVDARQAALDQARRRRNPCSSFSSRTTNWPRRASARRPSCCRARPTSTRPPPPCARARSRWPR